MRPWRNPKMKKKKKASEAKVRVTAKMRMDLETLANKREETISLIIREAVGEYLAKQRGTKKK
jgi:predicted transcriptional regulator